MTEETTEYLIDTDSWGKFGLAEAPEDDENRPPKDYFDPEELLQTELADWRDYWIASESMYRSVRSILERVLLLPSGDFLFPLICSYLFLPTRASRCVPILFSHGEAGSGKTTIANLANFLRGRKYLFGSTDTYSAIRNSLEDMRYYPYCGKRYKREGAMLCWDNLDSAAFKKDDKLYRLLLLGYNKRSAIMRTAGTKGGVEVFDTFCPKVMSSIEPFHTYPEYSELARRLWVIPHKDLAKFTKLDHERASSSASRFFENKIELESINWKGVEKEYYDFWDRSRTQSFAAKRAYLTNSETRLKLDFPECLKGANLEMSFDPICTGLVIGAWESYQEALDYMGRYYEFLDSTNQKDSDTTIILLERFIREQLGSFLYHKDNPNGDVKSASPDSKISSGALRRYCKTLEENGAILEKLTHQKVKLYMKQLGWILTPDGWTVENQI